MLYGDEAVSKLRPDAPPVTLSPTSQISLPHPSQDPALDPKVRTNMVRLARAYQKGGKAALAKAYDELYPEKKAD